jgi:hypothetical protein
MLTGVCGHVELVILNGGEAAVRDPSTAGRFDVVDGNAQGACSAKISPTALPLYALRKVPRRAIALLRMTIL